MHICRKVLTKMNTSRILSRSFKNETKEEKKMKTLKVIVDHSRSFVEAIAAGRYDLFFSLHVESYKNHQDSSEMVTCALFHYACVMAAPQVIDDMRSKGFVPVAPDVLLAIGEQHPELQLSFPLVALGHSWRIRSRDFVLALTSKSGCRWLRLRRKDEPWCADSRFVATAAKSTFQKDGQQ